jgi:hypothetical protein
MKYFWLILTIAALLWYTLVTIYVSIKGAGDIKNMLRSLENLRNEEETQNRPITTDASG